MVMRRKFNKFVQVLFALIVFVAVLVPLKVWAEESEETPPKEWMDFLSDLKKDMISRGISEKTIEKAYGNRTYYHKKPEVKALEQMQAEFILTSTDYINRIVTKSRVNEARQKYKELQKKYGKIEEEYGVPLSYLTAFWAVETNFGQNKGKHHLIDSLTNLSYNGRRAQFFKNELYHVLKIMDKFDLSHEKIKGSWAGAMGHFQFMPSTYNAYAKDYDGDGVADVWDEFSDALASAANYLSDLKWKKDEPWGEAVMLPWNFDYHQTGRNIKKTVKEWKKIGVTKPNGKPLDVDDNLKASIIMPDGYKGPTYIVFSNFNRIMIWNRSDNYALAVGILADYISSKKSYQPVSCNQRYALTNKDIASVQKFSNKFFKTNLKIDGKLGPKTKEAIKKIQKKAKMPEDGVPSYRLLQQIKNYNPKTGFYPPLPDKKKTLK